MQTTSKSMQGVCNAEDLAVSRNAGPRETLLGFRGLGPHPVTLYIRGPIKGYVIYDHIIVIIQLLLRGGSTQGLGFWVLL